MELYTVEAFKGGSYELVLCTNNQGTINSILPTDYDANILFITTWKDGKKINFYLKEISNQF